ncbi:hypothetical protein [Ottowia thiooxydans]|uniref:hypothetical protein n=1 Tax=Ottowia thiooxydans TaxID=219182 RepID=UPI0012EB9143|nr:hypothetical protein [Ottowia thiooxydans]
MRTVTDPDAKRIAATVAAPSIARVSSAEVHKTAIPHRHPQFIALRPGSHSG